MQLTNALDDVFGGKSRVRVLRALYEMPDGLPVSGREVARRSGLSHPTALSVLASFTGQGIVHARRGLRGDTFELNRRHLLVERLHPLFDWERQLLQEMVSFLGQRIKREAPWISAAYLFGSSIRGEMTAASDIDLAVVVSDATKVDETDSSLARVADATRERFGNRVSVTIGASPINKLQRPSHPGHGLWKSIVREGVAVIPHG